MAGKDARRVVALAALVATALIAAPARAADPHPDQFLESGTVVAGTTYDRPFSTTASLVYGQWYRLVVSGTWTLQWPADPSAGYEAGEEEDDPVYCVRKDPKTDGFPCTTDYRSQTLGIKLGDSGDNYAGSYEVLLGCYEDPKNPAGQCVPGTPEEWPPPFAANTSYDITFQARHSGQLSFWDRYTAQYGYGDRGYPTSGSGSYGFQLFGMKDSGGGSTSGGGGGTTSWGKGSGWTIGPVKFRIPTSGYSFKGRKFSFLMQPSADVSVAESVTAYVGRKAYFAGKSGGALKAGTVYAMTVTVPKGAYKAIIRGLNAGKTVTMRTYFTVVGASGNVKKYIDLTFKR